MSGIALPADGDAWRRWYAEARRWWEEEGPAAFEQLTSNYDGEVVGAIRAVSKRALWRNRIALRLTRLLSRHGSPAVRREVCTGLARLGSRSAFDGLTSALDDADATVRAEAVRALRGISGLSLPPDRAAWSAALSGQHP
jgi:HEAT repeat protein